MRTLFINEATILPQIDAVFDRASAGRSVFRRVVPPAGVKE